MNLDCGNFAARLAAQRGDKQMATFSMFAEGATDFTIFTPFLEGEVSVEKVWQTRDGQINTTGDGRPGIRLTATVEPAPQRVKASKKPR